MSTQLPKNWAESTLEDIAEIHDNLREPVNSIERKNRLGPYPYYGATGQVGWIDDYKQDGVYVLLGEDGAPFFDSTKDTAYLVSGKCWVNNHAHVLKGRDRVCLNKYLLYALNQTDYRGYANGTTRLKLTQSAMRQIPINLAPLSEQGRIVAKIETLFSELDKGIESLKTAREQLKVYRQTVLKHAFEGKLTAHWREQNKDKLETPQQLLARIQKERQSRYQRQLKNWQTTVKVWEENDKEGKKPAKPMTPSGIRYPAELELADLPGGWCWVEYAGLCERIRNGISAKPEGDSGTKIFRISAVRAMEFALDDVRYIQNIGGIYDQYLLAQGDLVFTRYNGSRNYVGVCAEYKGDGTHLYPDKLIQTRIGVPSLSSKFLEGAINCGDSRRFIESRIRTTAGQSGISGGDIKSIPIPVCGTEEQEQIAIYLSEQTSEIDKMVEEVEAGVRRAETLRQSILKKAFSGQLVPQDANDEPASVLLARIQAENATHAVNSSKTTNKKTGKTSKQGS